MHKVVAEEVKVHGPVRYFWKITRLQAIALYRRMWHKNTLPSIKVDFMKNVVDHGIQCIFWDTDSDEIQSLYKKYYIDDPLKDNGGLYTF